MTPVVLEPPALLTDGGPELWVIASGPRDRWLGAHVLWSEDADDYDRHSPGQIGGETVVGRLIDPLPALEPLGREHYLAGVRVALEDAGTLAAVDDAAARRLQTLTSFGEGLAMELVAYTGARLIGRDGDAHLYRLDGLLLRGVCGTPVGVHQVGARFVRWDESQVARLRLPKRLLLGPSTVFLKILPINNVGEAAEPTQVTPIAVRLVGRWLG